MASYYTSGYTPPAGVTNADQVKKIQQQLTNAGYNIGRTGVDGVWGKNTQAAYTNYLNSSRGGGSRNVATTYYDPYEAEKAQINAVYQMQKDNLDAQAKQIGGDYDRARTQAYVNARLGAIGNNEQVAALGLGGNLYSGPRSGFSETSRIAENTAMRNDINEATLQEQALIDEINRQIAQAKLERDMQLAAFIENDYATSSGRARRGSTVASLGSSSSQTGSSGSRSSKSSTGSSTGVVTGARLPLSEAERLVRDLKNTQGAAAAQSVAADLIRRQQIDEMRTLESADGMSGVEYVNKRINEVLNGR